MQTKYVVELTKKEALAVAMLACSDTWGWPEDIAYAIGAIRMALEEADPLIYNQQFKAWQKLGGPSFRTLTNYRSDAKK